MIVDEHSSEDYLVHFQAPMFSSGQGFHSHIAGVNVQMLIYVIQTISRKAGKHKTKVLVSFPAEIIYVIQTIPQM